MSSWRTINQTDNGSSRLELLSFFTHSRLHAAFSNNTSSNRHFYLLLSALSGVSINYLCRAITITLRTFGLKRLSRTLAMGVISIISQPEGFAMFTRIALKNFRGPKKRKKNTAHTVELISEGAVRSFRLKWIYPQAHKYHILLTFMRSPIWSEVQEHN